MAAFRNRKDAGCRLASQLEAYRGVDAVVIGLPRGGIEVAAEVSRALGLPLSWIAVRKIGHPQNPEAAIGAVAESGEVSLSESGRAAVSPQWMATEIEHRRTEIDELFKDLDPDRPPLELRNRIAIVVDDGIATGHTMIAALKAAKALGAERVVAAAPVGHPLTLEHLKPWADEVVCVLSPSDMTAVGAYYEDFRPVIKERVRQILKKSRDFRRVL